MLCYQTSSIKAMKRTQVPTQAIRNRTLLLVLTWSTSLTREWRDAALLMLAVCCSNWTSHWSETSASQALL